MALVLDTAAVALDERADAMRAVMAATAVPVRSRVEGRGDEIGARVETWQLGPGVSLLHVASTSEHRLTRTARHLRGGAPEQISLAIQLTGRTTLIHRDLPADCRVGELQLLDLTSPFDYITGPDNAAQALYVDGAQLGLAVDVVRTAAPHLATSPLYELTRQHLTHVLRVADIVERSPTAALLGAATIELVRALIASAAESKQQRQALAESLMTRITSYMYLHLGEADLDPARIAAEHHISVRYLHLLFAQQELSVRRWLMRERLEAARRALAADSGRHSSIAAIGRRCGFPDPGHFARRFRAAYGISPRDWQRLSHPGPDA